MHQRHCSLISRGVLTVVLASLAMPAQGAAQQIGQPLKTAGLVPMVVPANVRCVAGQTGGRSDQVPKCKGRLVTHTYELKTRRGSGTVTIVTAGAGRVASIRMSENLATFGIKPTALVDNPSYGDKLSECVKREKCDEKPTDAGVKLCVANCVYEATKKMADDVIVLSK